MLGRDILILYGQYGAVVCGTKYPDYVNAITKGMEFVCIRGGQNWEINLILAPDGWTQFLFPESWEHKNRPPSEFRLLSRNLPDSEVDSRPQGGHVYKISKINIKHILFCPHSVSSSQLQCHALKFALTNWLQRRWIWGKQRWTQKHVSPLQLMVVKQPLI